MNEVFPRDRHADPFPSLKYEQNESWFQKMLNDLKRMRKQFSDFLKKIRSQKF